MVVDGGPPQVAAAQRALDELGIDDIALVGLAKRLEEVWLPGEADPVILPRSSEGLYLLQRVRDEAHRFAITYHRAKRSKSMTRSALEGIPGLGATRAGRVAATLRLGQAVAGRDGRRDRRGAGHRARTPREIVHAALAGAPPRQRRRHDRRRALADTGKPPETTGERTAT